MLFLTTFGWLIWNLTVSNLLLCFFFFNDTATTEIYTNLNTFPYTTLFRSFGKLHGTVQEEDCQGTDQSVGCARVAGRSEEHTSELQSHSEISYAVFCLK